MYVSPNFEVENDQDAYIISPEQDKNGGIKNYLTIERLAAGKSPVVINENIDTKRMILSKVDDNQSMWLYPNGEIKTER